ncbi:MAG: 16S rRNA (guanine(527)-N(7))-methyltransferase RsmG [Calditrichaeota bacterium]|nr:16S rRNA (guanine(527)-N(7))-methyltransferase RsmG [Calditrichota bacterium]
MKHSEARTATDVHLEAHLAALGACLARLRWSVGREQMALLGAYARLLLAWNRRVNLIARGDEPVLVSRHIAESLAFLATEDIAHGALVLDMGSGGGLPGIPMKIVRPDLQMVLLDAQRRKVLFLQEAVEALQLPGIQALCARAESLAALAEWRQKCDVVVARAVASLSLLWQWASPLLGGQGMLITLKGGDLASEVRALAASDPVATVRLSAPPACLVDPSKGRAIITVRRGAQT